MLLDYKKCCFLKCILIDDQRKKMQKGLKKGGSSKKIT